MSKLEIKLTAYCGLYCDDCIRYKSKFVDLVKDLADELKKVRFGKYAEAKSVSMKEFEHYKEFLEVLDAMAKLKCDIPCRAGGDGCSQSSKIDCKIKKCVQSKNFEGCWECDEFEGCGNFEFLKRFHGNTRQENLRKIKKYGLDKWAKYRKEFYLWL